MEFKFQLSFMNHQSFSLVFFLLLVWNHGVIRKSLSKTVLKLDLNFFRHYTLWYRPSLTLFVIVNFFRKRELCCWQRFSSKTIFSTLKTSDFLEFSQ